MAKRTRKELVCPPPVVPPEPKDVLTTLKAILDVALNIQDIASVAAKAGIDVRVLLGEAFEDVFDYFYVSDTVDSAGSEEIEVKDSELLKTSKVGWITNDSTADITASFNGKKDITLKGGETFDWGRENTRLNVDLIVVKTTSATAQAFRAWGI